MRLLQVRPGQQVLTIANRAELMATVVNKSQQVVTAGLKPAAEYSRVIAVYAAAGAGGVWGFGYSPSFGKESRLLKIDVTVQIEPNGELQRSWFSIHRGSGIPAQRQDVQAWDRLIDFGVYGGTHGMPVIGPWRQFSWDLTRIFSGEANRFGVLFWNGSSNNGVVHVFFKMSEG